MSSYLKQYKSNVSRILKLLKDNYRKNGLLRGDREVIEVTHSFKSAYSLCFKYFLQAEPNFGVVEEGDYIYFYIDLSEDKLKLSYSADGIVGNTILQAIFGNNDFRFLIDKIAHEFVDLGYCNNLSDVTHDFIIHNQGSLMGTQFYKKIKKSIKDVEDSEVRLNLRSGEFPKFSKRECFPILILDTSTGKVTICRDRSANTYRKGRDSTLLCNIGKNIIDITLIESRVLNYCDISIDDKNDCVERIRFMKYQ